METKQQLTLSSSGELLGLLVAAFELRRTPTGGKRLTDGTCARYFSGDVEKAVLPKNKLEIYNAIASSLLEAEIFPTTWASAVPPATVLATTLVDLVHRWDAFVGELRAASAPITRPALGAAAVLRLATIDVALRFAAIRHLAGAPPPNLAVPPPWILDTKQVLRDLVEIAKMTRAEFAEELDVSGTTADSWLDGNSRPSEASIVDIAALLASRIGSLDETTFRIGMRIQYAMSELYMRLVAIVGTETARSLTYSLERLSGETQVLLAGIPEKAAKEFVLFGCEAPHAVPLLEALASREPNVLWKTELRAATGSWARRVQEELRHISGIDGAAKKIAEEQGMPLETATRLAEAVVPLALSDQNLFPSTLKDDKSIARRMEGLASSASAEGDHETASARLREAVRRDPTNAQYHFSFGCHLGRTEAGLEGGIAELWIADSLLDGTWVRPRVEIGILLLERSRPMDARPVLEAVAADGRFSSIDSMDAHHLLHHLGIARLRTGAFDEALAALRRALCQKPDDPLSLDAAGVCCFELGHDVEGRRFVKRAHELGRSDAFNAWQAGVWRKNRGG